MEVLIKRLQQIEDEIIMVVAVELPREQKPRLAVSFAEGVQNRLLPLPLQWQDGSWQGQCRYAIKPLFWRSKMPTALQLSVVSMRDQTNCTLLPNDCQVVNLDIEKTKFTCQVKRLSAKTMLDWVKTGVAVGVTVLSLPFRLLPVRQNSVTILSNRHDHLVGNAACVHRALAQDDKIDLRCHLTTKVTVSYLFSFLHLYATSRVVLVDDHFPLLNFLPKRKSVRLIQLWHACGGFKTVGFSRLSGKTNLNQYAKNHRQYDYVLVSGQGVQCCYQEAFGLRENQVLALGTPRTDLLFDTQYRDQILQKFYKTVTSTKHKKVILFAPTFRGGGQGNATYPMDMFDPIALMDTLGDDYVLLLKLHPYLDEQFTIPENYRDRIIDCSTYTEINDLLFVTDLVITDYSSVIYEATLLEIPIVYYVFDLKEYIETRDFYLDFDAVAKGAMVQTADQLPSAILTALQHPAQSHPLLATQLDACDGQAGARAVQLIKQCLQKEECHVSK